MINILDVIILFIILFSAVIGMKKGAIKSAVSFIGIILCVIIAYALKNTLANILISYLPFFDFGGVFKGVSVLNILIYEAIAFLIIFSILQMILKLIIHFTSILEGLLKATIILGIPSKILGFILGLLEGYIYAFIVLFILSMFSFSIELTQTSKFNSAILNNTPILTNFAKDSYESISEIYSLKETYNNIEDKTEYNNVSIEILLKHNVVTIDTVEKLVKKDKLDITNLEQLKDKYRKDWFDD